MTHALRECPATYGARSDHYVKWETFGHVCSLGVGHLGSHRCVCSKGWSAWSWMHDPDAFPELPKTVVWRFTMMGVVAHAVMTNGTNRAIGRSLCGRESVDGQWHYGPHFGSRSRCLRCRRAEREVTRESE